MFYCKFLNNSTMTCYNYNGRLVFNIDDNSDNFESFSIAVEFLKRNENINIIKYYAGGWDVSCLNFIIDGIELELLFRDLGGTELSVNENTTKSNLSKIRQRAEEIYKEVHNRQSPI